MKTFFFTLIFISLGNILWAQTGLDTLPAYKSIPTIPPFKITLVPDSTAFTKYDLKKKKATLIIVFSPDCDHCIQAARNLLTHYNLYKKAQIIMATSLPYTQIAKFYREFNIAEYPNIMVGHDKSNFLGTFYNVKSFPAIFLYDKKGKFRQFFDGHVKFDKIAELL